MACSSWRDVALFMELLYYTLTQSNLALVGVIVAAQRGGGVMPAAVRCTYLPTFSGRLCHSALTENKGELAGQDIRSVATWLDESPSRRRAGQRKTSVLIVRTDARPRVSFDESPFVILANYLRAALSHCAKNNVSRLNYIPVSNTLFSICMYMAKRRILERRRGTRTQIMLYI